MQTQDTNVNTFKVETLEFFTGLTTGKLMKAIKENHLKLDLRLGVYKSGPNKGKLHDHVSGFRITYEDLLKYVKVDKYE